MAITKISIQEFLQLAPQCIIIDVRSPGEFQHAHIPAAYSLPLFTDDERKIVGTAYKQQSREAAIKIGLAFFGPKMVGIVEEVEQLVNKATTAQGAAPRILVHCWRGGMRSAGVAWLLDLYGFQVSTLTGGYKAYRHWVLQQFNKPYPLLIVGGYTGSGKTAILHQLKQQGMQVIDLESLACHKGSAFGALNGTPQPSQEMFDNLLATALHSLNGKKTIWVEDESQRIGLVNIPGNFFQLMRSQPLYFIEVPFEARLAFIVQEYGALDKDALLHAIGRIKKRLGGLETKTAINYLLEDNLAACFKILLTYYDKLYLKGLRQHEQSLCTTHTLTAASVDPIINTALLLQTTQTANEQ